MARIPLIDPEDLAPNEQKAYDIGKLDLTLVLGHAKTAYPAYRTMTHAVFAQLEIPSHERELIILTVVQLDRAAYPWAQHIPIAQELGITDEKIDAIAADRFNAACFSDREKALMAFTRQTVRAVRVDDPTFTAVAAFYTPSQLVEMLYVIGHYMTLGRMAEVFELAIDRVSGTMMHSASVKQEHEKLRKVAS